MPPARKSVPAYRHHKPTGQAVVTVRTADGGRRDVSLGKYDSPESRAEYARRLAEMAAAPIPGVLPAASGRSPKPAAGISVSEVLLAFMTHADAHYRRADGTPTNTIIEYRCAVRVLREFYGHTPAAEFGPLALKAVRGRMPQRGWCRTTINDRIGKLRRVFKWAAGEELVPGAVPDALRNVAGLQRGRTPAPEPEPVGPADPGWVEATLPHVGQAVAAMIEVQLLTGMRPGEVCRLRPCDLDASAAVWVYRPPLHKTAHRGKARVVAIGPKAQTLLDRFRPPSADGYYFSPFREATRRHADRAASRKTPRWPSHRAATARKRKATPKRSPGQVYTPRSYAHAVARGAERAGVGHWHPNQLRHRHATDVREMFGLEAAQVVLGHERADITQVYAERNLSLATTVAAVG